VLFLIKYGEISLKGRNRSKFELRLLDNIIRRLPPGAAKGRRTWGRLYLEISAEHAADAERIIGSTFGVVGFAAVKSFEKSEASLAHIASQLVDELGEGSFKVEVRREDKSFSRSSYEIACDLGDRLTDAAAGRLVVDVRTPDRTLSVEVRDRIYAYTDAQRGPSGLPSGVSGRGMLLLSGGIDSPVAGYLVAGRGLALDAVYFHSYPYTSEDAERKVHQLAARLAQFLPRLDLHVVPFTPLQLLIKERAHADEVTLLMRACMMEIAADLAAATHCSCLVTGESLGQVASQTLESMRVTGSHSTMPVLRPLVGLSKEEIIDRARQIGTYETSILPFPDCCTLFAPKHPVIRPNFERLLLSFERLQADELLAEAAAAAVRYRIGDEVERLAVGAPA
jgi:thiamine biosynthesis protein ThiI